MCVVSGGMVIMLFCVCVGSVLVSYRVVVSRKVK